MYGACIGGTAAPSAHIDVIWRDSNGAVKLHGNTTSLNYGLWSACVDDPSTGVMPGDKIKVSDGSSTRSYVVPNFTMRIDRVNEQYTGTGPAGRTIKLGIPNGDTEHSYGVRVAQDGTWAYKPTYGLGGSFYEVFADANWTSPNSDRLELWVSLPQIGVTLGKPDFAGVRHALRQRHGINPRPWRCERHRCRRSRRQFHGHLHELGRARGLRLTWRPHQRPVCRERRGLDRAHDHRLRPIRRPSTLPARAPIPELPAAMSASGSSGPAGISAPTAVGTPRPTGALTPTSPTSAFLNGSVPTSRLATGSRSIAIRPAVTGRGCRSRCVSKCDEHITAEVEQLERSLGAIAPTP